MLWYFFTVKIVSRWYSHLKQLRKTLFVDDFNEIRAQMENTTAVSRGLEHSF